MRGLPAILVLAAIGTALYFSGKPEKPAEAAPVPHDYSEDIAKLQGELDTLRDERDELRAAYQARDAEAREYQNDRDRLLLKQSSLTPQVAPSATPRAVTYVAAGARGVCANGSCGPAQRQVYYAPKQAQPVRSFRPLRRLFGR